MEKLLEDYLKSTKAWDYIKINYFDINGSNCETNFYTDASHYYKETENINIWGMVLFLHYKNK